MENISHPHHLTNLIGKVVTVHTVPTAFPVDPQRLSMVYTGKLRSYDLDSGTLSITNSFFGREVETVFRWQHVVHINEEPEIDQDSEEYRDLLERAQQVQDEERERLVAELMPEAMEEAMRLAKEEVSKKFRLDPPGA